RPGTVRQSPPTPIGLRILATHLVTLDYQGSRILLHQRAAPEPERSHPGFALMPSGNRARVVQLFRGSAAKKAGLKLGDEVVAIDDQELSSDGAPCALARRLADSRSINSARYLTVLREGERV